MLIVGPKLFNSGDVGYGMEAVFEAVFALDELLVPES